MTTAVWQAYNPSDVRPGWGALVLVVLLGLAIYLLWRSMNTQLGRIQMPPTRGPDTRIPGASGPAGGAPGATDVNAAGDETPPPASPPPST